MGQANAQALRVAYLFGDDAENRLFAHWEHLANAASSGQLWLRFSRLGWRDEAVEMRFWAMWGFGV